jgi:hypothetical protein
LTGSGAPILPADGRRFLPQKRVGCLTRMPRSVHRSGGGLAGA